MERKRKLRDYFEEQGGRCGYCTDFMTLGLGYPATATIDHIIPLSKGGLRKRFNELAACQQCNTQKADKSLRQFLVEINGFKTKTFNYESD